MKLARLALLLAAASLLATCPARADDSTRDRPGIQTTSSLLMRPYTHPQVAGAAAVYETTWVGFSASDHRGPKNWWNVYAGVNRPGTGDPANAVWDFEHPAFAHGDSLMGWWPTNHCADPLGDAPTDDFLESYACLDFGNGTNATVPGTSGRTWGLVGAWHSDPGRFAGRGVTWTPLAGSRSAWCGLREHGDLSVVDAVTGNPYNQDAADFLVRNTGPSVKNFPGYVRQWDQMLYRDIVPVEGQPLTLSFLYRTWMSTEFEAGAGRRGWFHGDPLSTAAGNFIRSNAQPGPIDSFQVFIGVPAEGEDITLSTGGQGPVQDPQRRWFSEVLRLWDGPDDPYYELTSCTGRNPAAPDTTGSMLFSAMIPWPIVSTIVYATDNTSGNVRLVFRVKTNNTGDDLTSATWGELGGRGAAQVDDVAIRWGAGATVVIGDFEGAEGDPGNVNNAAGASAVAYWKSTGKPPAMYFHARPLAGLRWLDLCGPVGAPGRRCDMQGSVLDAGNETNGETVGDNSYAAGAEGVYGCLSPTIDLTTTVSPNPMGLTVATAAATDDYYVRFDVYSEDFARSSENGVFYSYGCAAYPNRSAGTGTEQWGDLVTAPSLYYDSDPHCYGEILPLRARNLLFTSAPSGRPDSLRIWIGVFNLPSGYASGNVGWNPANGAYFDNVSLAIVNRTGGTGNVGPIASDLWQWFSDAFPVASGVALGAGTSVAALDTCGALVKGARNIAQPSAVAGLMGQRLDVLADSIVVSAPDLAVDAGDTNSTHVRVDMVFRILPGPGNYRAQAGLDTLPKYPLKRGMHLLRRPDDRTTLVDPSDAADHSFWAEYLRDPGEFASGNHPTNPLTGKREWSNLTWNSARCDTAETNQFPTSNLTATFPVRPGLWQSTVHESDPKYAVLGIPRPRCFVVDTSRATDLTSANVVCGSAPRWLATLPGARSGWDGTASTIEGTRIIPYGLLTPGSHVQYFFRKSQVFGRGGYAMDPDTQTIVPQRSESNFDGHRWEQFGVLPDSWKDLQFGGAGMACTLYLDDADRRGDELVWASVMDSASGYCGGGTAHGKWGAYNGWHSAGGVVLDAGINPNLQSQAFTYGNAQAGTAWELYKVRGAESGGTVGTRPGGRLGLHGMGALLGHDNQVAPTPDMLKQFYSAIVLLSGDLDRNVLGPARDVPEDDVGLLGDFLTSSTGLQPKPRGLIAMGSGFAQSEGTSHPAFLSSQLGLFLAAPSYAALAANNDACTDLTSTSVISSTDIYGVGLDCSTTEDVLTRNVSKPGTQNVSFYKNTGSGPYTASVYHARQPLTDAENFTSLVSGFDIADLWGRNCSTTYGRLAYVYNVTGKIIGQLCGSWLCACGLCTDVPDEEPALAPTNHQAVGNSLVRSGTAAVRFGVATTGRVRVRLYDAGGRMVRVLVDRTCAAGEEYVAQWDGRDDAGRSLPRGVYFVRTALASGAGMGGRIVLLR